MNTFGVHGNQRAADTVSYCGMAWRYRWFGFETYIYRFQLLVYFLPFHCFCYDLKFIIHFTLPVFLFLILPLPKSVVRRVYLSTRIHHSVRETSGALKGVRSRLSASEVLLIISTSHLKPTVVSRARSIFSPLFNYSPLCSLTSSQPSLSPEERHPETGLHATYRSLADQQTHPITTSSKHQTPSHHFAHKGQRTPR